MGPAGQAPQPLLLAPNELSTGALGPADASSKGPAGSGIWSVPGAHRNVWWALLAAPKPRPSPAKPPSSSQGEGEGTQETHGPARRGGTCPSPLPAGHGEPAWRAIHPGPCPSGLPALPGTRSPRGVPGAALGAEALVSQKALRTHMPSSPSRLPKITHEKPTSQPPKIWGAVRGQSAPAGHCRAATAGRNHRSKADPRLMQLPVSGGRRVAKAWRAGSVAHPRQVPRL